MKLQYRSKHFLVLCLPILVIWIFFLSIKISEAKGYEQDNPPESNLSISDEVCMDCHGQSGLTLTLENGDILDLYVDPVTHYTSIHGQSGYACVQCHRDVGDYPHPQFSAIDRRDVSLQLYDACFYCHAGQYELVQDSVHEAALESGNREAAICTDCHTAHNVQQLVDPATGDLTPSANLHVPQTCAKCHSAIYEKYRQSVHGEALTEGNPDVPTCIDCHGVHNIEDPTTNQFRLYSPELCAECHADEELMAKYGLSTYILDTYVSDFHGSTVYIFEKLSPDQETNKPVCYDCHGIHDIHSVDDPEAGLLMKENLLVTCQKCHPDADTNFPTAWLGHYTPSPQISPLVYYVNLFYKIFIPTVLGGMLILVALDISSVARKGFRSGSKKTFDPTLGTAESVASTDDLEQNPDSTSDQIPDQGGATNG